MRLRVALVLGVVLVVPGMVPGRATAQMSPPMGNLAAPQPRAAQPAAPSAAPQPSAVPRAPVQQVAPMASPPLPQPPARSSLGTSQPGKPSPPARTPVVTPKPNAGPQKPAAAPSRPGTGTAAGVAAGVAAGAAAGAAAAGVAGAKPPEAKPAETKPPEAKPAETKPAEARPTEPAKGSVTGQPLPRWAGILYDGVKLRVGPGQRYPVEWVYRRPDQPVRILREFETWRLVEDHEGVKGWVHQSNLTGRRSFMVPNERTLRRSAGDDSAAVAVLRPGVVGRVRSCDAGAAWCQVRVGDHRGWLKREGLWGLSPGEAVGN